MKMDVFASAETNGTCGENVTWSFNENTGAFTVSGTGDIENYIDYYNNKRIKEKLKGMSPVQYRTHSLVA